MPHESESLCAEQSIPSGRREAFDAAIEIAQDIKLKPGNISTFDPDDPAHCAYNEAIDHIVNELQAACDAAPASIGYDQRTIEAACKTAESATRAFIARSLDPDDSSLLHSRNDYWQRGKGAEFVLEQLRALATTPVHEGER